MSIIECFGDLKILRSLKKLDVSNNGDLWIVDLANFSPTLQELNLANNISTIRFADMPSLQKLSVQGQGIIYTLSLPSQFGDAFTMQQLRVLDYDSKIEIPEGLKHKLDSWKK